MNETHPPIPPNCPYFRELSWGWSFSLPENPECDAHDWKVDDCGVIRPIIAAVAEVAWRKEAVRIESGCKCPYLIDIPRKCRCDECCSLITAWDNVDAWRAWGESK